MNLWHKKEKQAWCLLCWITCCVCVTSCAPPIFSFVPLPVLSLYFLSLSPAVVNTVKRFSPDRCTQKMWISHVTCFKCPVRQLVLTSYRYKNKHKNRNTLTLDHDIKTSWSHDIKTSWSRCSNELACKCNVCQTAGEQSLPSSSSSVRHSHCLLHYNKWSDLYMNVGMMWSKAAHLHIMTHSHFQWRQEVKRHFMSCQSSTM